MKKQSTFKLNIALAVGLLLTIIFSSFTSFATECNDIRQSVLRLHILANTNSQEDQQLKLQVRDAILKLDHTMFDQATDLTDAKNTAKNSLELIRETAQSVVNEKGFSYEVKAEVCKVFFDTRYYEDFTMPAGRYDAVRVTIGQAKGKNWWCVLYPPLCLPAATANKDLDKELKEALSDKQIKIVKGKSKYEFRFASVELFEKLKKLLFDYK